jgi:CcmD family protein
MKKLLPILIFSMFTLYCRQSFAQNTLPAAAGKVEMADALRQNGKIYVVVIVVLIVLSGLLLYIFSLDRKIGKIEKELNSRQN